MALAIDGSSPAITTQTSGTTATLATGSFTPPAGALLLIGWAGNTGTASDPGAPSITDSLGAHLTYTQIGWKHRTSPAPTVDGQAAMWWAQVGSSAAMTVTVTTGTGSGAQQAALKVWVITGHDTATPIGASGATGSTSAASIAQSYTAQATGGQSFMAVCDWDLKGVETAGTGATRDGSANVGTDISYGFFHRTAADDSNGASNTLNATIPGTSTNLSWVYAEVKPAATAAGSAITSAQIASIPAPRRIGQATVTRPVADPAVDTPPVVEPAVAFGRPPAMPGSSWLATPRSEPSPAQNQPLPEILVVAGRPPVLGGTTVVLGLRADPPAGGPPCPEPFMSIGRPAPAVATATVLTPRAGPDPSQNQPTVEPVIVAGRPAALAGGALVTASRSDPATSTPPAPPPAISAGRPLVPAGGVALLAPHADPPPPDIPPVPTPVVSAGRPAAVAGPGVLTVPRADAPADQPPAPAVLVAVTAPRRRAGAAVTARSVAEEARSAPPDVLVAAPVRAWAAAPAVLTRPTLTVPAPVLVVRPPVVTVGVRLRVAGMAWFGHATSDGVHVCPPPTPRPDTGTTNRPDAGLTLFGGAVTGRPDTGITARPNTGTTPIC